MRCKIINNLSWCCCIVLFILFCLLCKAGLKNKYKRIIISRGSRIVEISNEGDDRIVWNVTKDEG
jgi:hypothetical protein